MKHKIKARFACLVTILFCATGVAFAQSKQVKKTPVRSVSPESGAEMYRFYCAACHGKTGEGNGPAADALKIPPADLATLAERNGGKFPTEHVISVLRFGVGTTAHGTSEMPIWGPLFSSLHSGNEGIVMMRINNLIRYLKTLQKK